ncbi:major facilitator superfamily domain-containing protein [Dipodascopsis uninucleata]
MEPEKRSDSADDLSAIVSNPSDAETFEKSFYSASGTSPDLNDVTLHSDKKSMDLEAQKAADEEEASKPQAPKPRGIMMVVPLMDLDNGVVGFDSKDDPAYPRNWPKKKKWLTMSLIAISSFMLPLGSTLFAPGVRYVATEFHETNTTILSLMVSIFISGFGWGPMFVHAPLSELYGRRYVITASNLMFALFNIGCALSKDTSSFIAFRFLGGFFGCASLTVGGGAISDMFSRDEMGTAASIFALGPMMGPTVGPIIGGFIAENIGWRWSFRLLLIVGVVMSVGYFTLSRETHVPTLLKYKTSRLRKELGRPDLVSYYDKIESRTHRTIFWNAIFRPLHLLTTNLVVTFLGFYMGIAFAYLYIFFTTVTSVFEENYGFSVQITGICYLGLGLGLLTGLFGLGMTSDRLVAYLTKKNGVRYPEYRLRPLYLSCTLFPIAMFWYGWATQAHAHWFAVVASMYPLGLAMVSTMFPIQTYLIEVFAPYGFSASATAAGNCFRMTAAGFFPLVAPTLFKRLGMGWGCSLLGFLALFMLVSMVIIFNVYGVRLRTYCLRNYK